MSLSNYQKVKEWRKKNPEKRKEQGRRYAKKHKEKVNEYSKKYRKNNIEKVRKMDAENARKRRRNNPEAQRLRNLKFKERMEAKRVAIAGRPRPEVCELCGDINCNFPFTKYKTLFDHCHVTGKFRGWICDRCNKVLGLVDDNTELLQLMINYLQRGGSR